MKLTQVLNEVKADGDNSNSHTIQKALRLAAYIQSRATELQTPEERRQQSELERMLQTPDDKVTLTQMTDQAFRSEVPRRVADQLTHILDVQGVPRFFNTFDRLMLKGFQSFGGYLPGVSVPLVKDKMREETANVILPAEAEHLSQHLEQRRQSGVRMNLNYLGEALLGEAQAQRRMNTYLEALRQPWLEVMSVKVSTIYSQITSLGRDHSIEVLCDRMELLYKAAAETEFVRADGTRVPKFVYLDMEEYRDLSITVEVFMKTLDRPGFENISAGIALQAYVPDSFDAQKTITEWAKKRVASGGSPVCFRLVKGANMEMERVEASVGGWEQAPYQVKMHTDANYKRMLQYAYEEENIQAIRIGVASHNLFDLAYAITLAEEKQILDLVQFEMLEGMANAQRRALCELVDNVLLYAPATYKEDFINAIGYLVRRLDENTGPENFLRHAFKLEVNSEKWKELELGFIQSFAGIKEISSGPRRTQDRNREIPEHGAAAVSTPEFLNEPDTDFALEPNVDWAKNILRHWEAVHSDNAIEIPLVVGGNDILDDRSVRECRDPSIPEHVIAKYRQANEQDLQTALSCAAEDPDAWRDLDEQKRGKILSQVAQELRKRRNALMGAALADGGKILSESDPEVSEAIDFVEYYAATARDLRSLGTVSGKGKGVVAVVSPWNFPIAIPCGGISAALAAGNTVILKPASSTVLVAYELCKCFWDAGVPKSALQFFPCSGAGVGSQLVASSKVDVVILTGGTDTALRMLEQRPDMNLLAETGGKNATIVTGLSDREQAIKHILHSAFNHAGQKCSATSLLILEDEVYEDEEFKAMLCDAARSLKVGTAWHLHTKLGPLNSPPSGDLETALTRLEEGESWGLEPKQVDANPHLYSPGIKWGVKPGSYTHMTEFFGPVLGVMRAKDIYEAVELVNQTGFGLTSGLESLDEREQDIWLQGIRAGNLYLNRVTTGAVVQRQPFGGMGKSAFGPGIKAGGPNYVAQLMDFSEASGASLSSDSDVADQELRALVANYEEYFSAEPALCARLNKAVRSYEHHENSELSKMHDDVQLVGQDNFRRYRPVEMIRIRLHEQDSEFDIMARIIATKIVGCRATISYPEELSKDLVSKLDAWTQDWGACIEFVEESDEVLASLVKEDQTDRIRYAHPDRVPEIIHRAAGPQGVYVAATPPIAEGRVELLWYVYEQSISSDYHRYGNLGQRVNEVRRLPE